MSDIKEKIEDVKAAVKEDIAEKVADAKEKVADAKEKAAEVKEAVKEDIAEKVADAKEKAAEVKETLESKAGEAKEALEDKADEVKETFAKAGKKSRKHLEEVKAEAERLERKAERKAEELAGEKPKGAAPKVRPLLERRGKKYQEAHKLVEKGKIYNLKDALELAIKTSPVKFDASVEVHARLGVDPRQADQNIRTTLVLPNGSGKDVRVAVFAPEDVCKVAKAAGADIAEDADFLKQLDKGEINFDILISVPAYMPKLGKYARMLGPKGLMPNPKAGTVTMDVERAVKEAKAGKVEYRVDKQGIVHLSVGKVSFGADKLYENATAFFDSLKAQKPASLKGTYVKSIFITTTMGPSIQIENLYN